MSLAVIMFELTDTLTYVVPVMLAVLVAKTVANALEPKGIYDLCIERVTSFLPRYQVFLMGIMYKGSLSCHISMVSQSICGVACRRAML